MSPQPLVYLCYPVYTSVAQRNLFVDKLLLKVRTACALHSQQALPIRDRMTVLNALLFSKFWRILRILLLASAQLQQFQGVASTSLNGHRFPKISFATLPLPRKHDGAGTLDHHIQQMTLQWRWLLPLLANFSTQTCLTRYIPYLQQTLSRISGHLYQRANAVVTRLKVFFIFFFQCSTKTAIWSRLFIFSLLNSNTHCPKSNKQS